MEDPSKRFADSVPSTTGGSPARPNSPSRIPTPDSETANDLDAMRYRILVEYGLGLICTHDLPGNLLTINAAAAEAIGFTPEQLVGRNVRDLLPASVRHLFDQYLRRIQREGVDEGLMRLATPHGREMIWLYRNVLYREANGRAYVLGHAQDVTRLYRAKAEIREVQEHLEQRVEQRTRELREANDRLQREVDEHRATADALSAIQARQRALLEAMPDLIFRVRRDGTFLDYMPAQELRPYVSPNVFMGKNLREVLPRDVSRACMTAIRRACESGRIEVVEYELKTDGEQRAFEARVIASGGEEVVAVVRDVSERKQAEAARRWNEERLQHAQKLESLGALAGGIAHDFNNLLMSILGYAELALTELPAGSAAIPQIDKAINAATRASELTMQLLTYAGSGTSSKAILNINGIVRGAEQHLNSVVSSKARLVYELSSDLPHFTGDEGHVRQALLNLVENASESLGDETGTITIATLCTESTPETVAPELPVDDDALGGYVQLRVSDSGCGMDEETRGRIFDPFFTTKFTGRGLGLATVLGVVREHGGALNVTSTLGQGTTVDLWFPATVHREGGGDRAAEGDGAKSATWRGKGTVLVVDDDPRVRDVARQMLERTGFSVVVAENGKEGLHTYEQHSEIVAVLLDLTMPVMGGKEALSLLKRLSPSLPVVLMSGYDEPDVTKHADDGQAVAFLQKPFVRQRLVDALRSVMHE